MLQIYKKDGEYYISTRHDPFYFLFIKVIILFDKIHFRENEQILGYSLRILGNVCECSDEKTQKVLEEGFVKELKNLLSHHSTKIRKDAVWIISNIAVGSQNHIESLIEENIFIKLKELVKSDYNIIRKEAMWAICNLSNIRNPYYAEVLIEQEYLEILIHILQHTNPKYIVIALEAITNMLELENLFYNVIYFISEYFSVRTITR